jgi:hypothetical protein
MQPLRKLSQGEELFIRHFRNGNRRFLIYHGGKFNYVMVCENLLRFGLFFMIDREMVTVQLSDIIMPGEPGKMRSIFIKDPKTGDEELIARFIDFQDERFRPESGTTTILFKVVIRGDDSDVRIVQQEDILPKFPTRDECLQQEARLKAFSEIREKAIWLQFPLAGPITDGKHFCYPFFPYKIDIIVLWRLVKRTGIELGNTYPFNNLMIRLLACGPQIDHSHEVKEVTQEEEPSFKKFEKEYKERLMGTVMESSVLRHSYLPEEKVFKMQCAVGKALQVTSKCALLLSDQYFTRPEIGVILRRSPNGLPVPHSLLARRTPLLKNP